MIDLVQEGHPHTVRELGARFNQADQALVELESWLLAGDPTEALVYAVRLRSQAEHIARRLADLAGAD